MLDIKGIELTNHAGNNRFVADIKIDDDLNITILNAKIETITFIQEALTRSEECGIFPDDCYYKFQATLLEETYVCEWILIASIQPQLNNGISYTAKLSKVETASTNRQFDGMSIILNLSFEEIIPLMGYLGPNFKTKRFGVIDVRHGPEGKYCIIKCNPDASMVYPEIRLTEILRFCTGSDINWIQGQHGNRKFYQRSGEPLFKARHISVFPLDQAESISLFDAISDYLMPNTEPTYSPILDSVVNVCQSQNNILNYRLVVGAAVEYLMKKFNSTISFPLDYYAKLDSALEILESTDFDSNIKKKLESAIDSYRKVQPKKILNLMKAHGLIDKRHISAYDSIRHSGAHGDDLMITEVNNLFLKANGVLDLIFRIILNGIGYRGYYYSPIERGNEYFQCKVLPQTVAE